VTVSSSTTRAQPRVSFVIATFNRVDALAGTLRALGDVGLDAGDFETIVVDNASTDQTRTIAADAGCRVVSLDVNLGSCAKALGVRQARGRYVVFLDDDSYPTPGTIERMIRYFEGDLTLGAAGFRIHLPDGREECGALPNIFVGCGVGFRAEALRGCGGLDATLFMQAEEYDLAFRLDAAGWRVQCFDDLHARHDKTPQARCSARTIYHDMRNNILVAGRYLPELHLRIYLADWISRYQWFAEGAGLTAAYERGLHAGLIRLVRERYRFRHRRLLRAGFERFFQWEAVQHRMGELSAAGVRRIALAGVGKNVYPFVAAARRCGIEIRAMHDDRFAAPGRMYRALPIRPIEWIGREAVDAVVVSDMAPVAAARTRASVAGLTPVPVHAWYAADRDAALDSTSDAVSADETALIR